MKFGSYRIGVHTYNEILGAHRWPKAPDCLAWLRNPHVHYFQIRCLWEVQGPDRELEIFQLQDAINRFIDSHYPMGTLGGFDFKARSCEQIAVELLQAFDRMEQCQVLEDGKGGGMVARR